MPGAARGIVGPAARRGRGTTMPLPLHLGHLGPALDAVGTASHDHWGAAIGVGIAIGVGVIGWIGNRPPRDDADADAPDAEEAPA